MRLTRWDQELTTEQTNEVLLLLSDWHLAQCVHHAGEKQFEEVKVLVRDRDYLGLCLYELQPTGDIELYRHLRQVLAFFQKRSDLDVGIDTAGVAWTKFVAAEARCRETNEIFRSQLENGFFFRPHVESVIATATRKVAMILGPCPELSQLRFRFGPGASTQIKKKEASARRKLSQKFCVSKEAVSRASEVLAELPLWSQVSDDPNQVVTHSVLVEPGRVDFVRKNAKTDRTIVVEPMLNSMVQLGFGDYIAGRLRRSGVDLRDQTRNQRLALSGSLDGGLATLDLSSASDLISDGLVAALLPWDWYESLSAFRTGTVLTPDGPMELEKFSSMGNGFTFALESLIFFALAKSASELSGYGDYEVNVYGDDIVVPVQAVPLLIESLTACGFEINEKKSYWSGSFRESCGKDYFSGVDVRPSYVKDVLSGRSIFTLYNSYVRKGYPAPLDILLETIDVSLRLFGPDGYGDGHLLGDFEPVPHNRDIGWSGFTFETYTDLPKRMLYTLGGDFVFPSYSVYMSEGSPIGSEPQEHCKRILRRLRRRRVIDAPDDALFGGFRADRRSAVYRRDRFGRVRLEDTLAGVSGYKRIRIYALG